MLVFVMQHESFVKVEYVEAGNGKFCECVVENLVLYFYRE